MTTLDLFTYAFMQRAFIAGALLGLLLASLGVIASLRRMTFFGEGIAHASLAGIAIAVLFGWAPLPIAILWAILVATIIFFLERSTKLPTDTLIGMLFTASMAFGIILIHFLPGYQPELLTYLFGSILAIGTQDVWITAILTIVILGWFFPSLKGLTFASLSEESAQVTGIDVGKQTYLFYIALAVTTVLGVKILGIILVPALLVLPTATSRVLANSFKNYVIGSILFAECFIIAGLIFSYLLDLPSGATIVLVGTLTFLLATLMRPS